MLRKRSYLIVTMLLFLCLLPWPLDAAQSSTVAHQDSPSTVQSTPSPVLRLFSENVGQHDPEVRFMGHGGPGFMFLTDDALWITLVKPDAVASDPAAPVAPGIANDPVSEEIQGVNLKISFVAANSDAALAGFEKVDTVVSYYRGAATEWRTNVPVWRSVRSVELYPGLDLEINSENDQFSWRLMVRDETQLAQVRLHVEGAELMTLDGDRLVLHTPLGAYILPLLGITGNVKAISPNPTIVGNEVVEPFASADADSSPAVQTTPAASVVGSYLGTFLGGSALDQGYAIAGDSFHITYITGWTWSQDFPTTPGPYTEHRGHYDTFVSSFNQNLSTLHYSVLLGNTLGTEDRGQGIAVERRTGHVYVVGLTRGSGFPVTFNAYDQTYNDGPYPWGDIFVSKLDSSGNLLYSTYLGGSNSDVGAAVAFLATDQVYVAGSTASTNFPTTAGAFRPQPIGGFCGYYVPNDALLVQLDLAQSGSAGLLYSTYLGGATSCDYGHGLATGSDASGVYAYITGKTSSTDFPTTSGAFQTSYGGGPWDAYVVKLRPRRQGASDLRYATYLGGNSQDSGNALAIDAATNAYVTGWTTSANYPTTPGAFQRNLAGAKDVFVTKLDINGSAPLYSTYLGGGEGDEPGAGNAIVVDAAGSAYVTGKVGGFSAAGFPVTFGAFQTQFGGYGDGFMTKFYPDGALQYSTFLGGAHSDHASALIYSSLPPQVYVTGITKSANFPVSPGGYSQFYSGGSDAFVADLQVPVAEQLVFGSDRSGNTEIYRMSANGANVTNLTNNQANDFGAQWASFASLIAFRSERDGALDLFVMASDGSGVTNLTNSSAKEFDVSWSPNDQRIAFIWNDGATYGITVIDANGANRKDLLTTESRIGSLVWSPQGNQLAFDMIPPCGAEPTNCDRSDIYTLQPDGSNLTNLTRHQASDGHPTWSPDGTQIAFASWRDGDADIYVLHLASFILQPLTNNAHYDGLPEWSPDGSRIVFISARDGNEEIYTVRPDGSNQMNLTRNAARDGNPAWSPDGNKIAFVTRRSGNDEIYIMNANGGERINLTNHPESDTAPAWDPTWY